MSLKETSVTRKFDYESPDGDSYRITYLENDNKIDKTKSRKYVEIVRLKEDASPDSDPVRWDYDMLIDLANTLSGLNRKPLPQANTSAGFPKIVDYRSGVPTTINPTRQSEQIEQIVHQTMNRYDDSAVPIESFNPDAVQYVENATGVSANEDVSAPVTPEDLSLQDPNAPKWKKEAIARMTEQKMPDPLKKIRSVSIQDLI